MWEARGVRCGLDAELGEIEIGSRVVPAVHGVHESSLGVDSIEDHGIDENDQNLDDDFDDGANQTPVLGRERKD